MDVPVPLIEVGGCHTVADVIDRFIRDGESDKSPARPALVQALQIYGVVVWFGRAWWSRMPPRFDQINSVLVLNAADCRWPPRSSEVNADSTPAEPPPEKAAGYVQQLPW